MSSPQVRPFAGRRAFPLPLIFLAFGVLSFLLLNGAFALGLSSIAEAWFRNPWALLVTHLFTLGYVTAIIMGAVYQLVPVILETSLWSQKLGYAHVAIYITGVSTLLVGFWFLSAVLLATGASLVLTGIVLFLINTFTTMRGAKHWHITGTFLICSLTYLATVASLGLLLAVNLPLGFLGASTKNDLILHAVLGFGGWLSLTIMGVAYRLIPLFTLSHHKPGRQTYGVLVLTNLGILGLAVAAACGASQTVKILCLAIGVVGVALFLSEMHQIIHRRVRKELDLGARFAVASLIALAMIMLLTLIFLAAPDGFATPARAVGLLYATGMGWVSLMVVGQMYKIVPFLVWTARYAPVAGKEKVPLLREMYDEKAAIWTFWLLVAGTLLVVSGLWLTWLPLATAGALLTTAGAALFGWEFCTILRS
jgi:hypothetical protein